MGGRTLEEFSAVVAIATDACSSSYLLSVVFPPSPTATTPASPLCRSCRRPGSPYVARPGRRTFLVRGQAGPARVTHPLSPHLPLPSCPYLPLFSFLRDARISSNLPSCLLMRRSNQRIRRLLGGSMSCPSPSLSAPARARALTSLAKRRASSCRSLRSNRSSSPMFGKLIYVHRLAVNDTNVPRSAPLHFYRLLPSWDDRVPCSNYT